jgi:hypothetical protein
MTSHRPESEVENPYESPRDVEIRQMKSLRTIERENETLATIGCLVLIAVVAAFAILGFVGQ